MIKAIIIDDEVHCVDTLSILLADYCPEVEVMEKCYLEQEYPEWQLHLELKLSGWVCAGVEAVSNSSCGSKQCGF